jgi:hypothetical protein
MTEQKQIQIQAIINNNNELVVEEVKEEVKKVEAVYEL